MLPLFSTLVTETDEARRSFETNPVVRDAVAYGMPLERYQKLLLELYHIVWHFNPVCAAAASRLSDANRKVRYYLYEHMQQEAGHEEWVMNDLKAVGVEEAQTLAHQPSLNTLALNGYNYWSADRREPTSVLGMMYVLEVIASVYGGAFSAAIKESLLLVGDSGVSFINSHASLDVGHMAELRTILNTVQDPESRDAVIESALVNFQHVTRIFAEI